MIRATTPTHIFEFPEDILVTDMSKIVINYVQCCKNILKKTEQDVQLDAENNAVNVDLTQNEMNQFHEGKCQIQVRAKDKQGKVMASQILELNVKKVLNEEIL